MATELQQLPYSVPLERVDERRVPFEERRAYQIKTLWDVHSEIVNLHALGFKGTQISKILNIHPQTVSNTINSVIGSEKLAELREIRDGQTKERLEQIRILTDEALKVYSDILRSENSTNKEKIEVSDTIVNNLSGLKVPDKVVSAGIILTAEELAEMKRRGIEAMKANGTIVDIPAEKVS